MPRGHSLCCGFALHVPCPRWSRSSSMPCLPMHKQTQKINDLYNGADYNSTNWPSELAVGGGWVVRQLDISRWTASWRPLVAAPYAHPLGQGVTHPHRPAREQNEANRNLPTGHSLSCGWLPCMQGGGSPPVTLLVWRISPQGGSWCSKPWTRCESSGPLITDLQQNKNNA